MGVFLEVFIINSLEDFKGGKFFRATSRSIGLLDLHRNKSIKNY